MPVMPVMPVIPGNPAGLPPAQPLPAVLNHNPDPVADSFTPALNPTAQRIHDFSTPSVLRTPEGLSAARTGGVVSPGRAGPSKAKRTLLVLGDDSDWDSYTKFRGQLFRCRPDRLVPVCATYEQLAAGGLPAIETDAIIVFPFFPHAYWDRLIEPKDYDGVYGNVEFFNKFKALWDEINASLYDRYRERTISFINPPLRIPIDRDKELTKAMLAEAGIGVAAPVFSRDPEEILRIVNQENRPLYLKVRYGSMGKGITYMEKGQWKTNFRFASGKIVSRRSDHDWTFVDITDNVEFLKELLTKDIVIEEALTGPIFDGQKFDLRFYVFFDRVLYIYARTNDAGAVTTNISQGGRGRAPQFLKKIAPEIMRQAVSAAIASTRILGLGFAGVDIMISRDMDRVFVIELNAFPGFPKMQTYPKFNLSRRLIRGIETRRF